MRIYGLTGSSGAGKSAAAERFRARGAGVVDADALYHTLCRENRAMLDALAEAFGDVLDADGTLNRRRLAAIVFADPAQLQRLDAITIPYIRAAALRAFAALGDRPLVLFDAPTLFQSGTDDLCGKVIGVVSDRETRIRRAMARDGLPEDDARARISAQPDDAFFRARCDYILENHGTPADLVRQVDALFDQLTKENEK